jgi:DNA-binding MarR family transcriptional regulator
VQESAFEPDPIDRQLRQLIHYFDMIARRLMLERPVANSSDVEVSRQEAKAVIVLGRRGAIMMSDLARILNMALSTATNTIDKLVAKGLAERSRGDEDRRIVQVGLSEKGTHLYESFLECQLAMGRTMLEALSHGEREIFLELIAKMTEPKPESAESEMELAARSNL